MSIIFLSIRCIYQVIRDIYCYIPALFFTGSRSNPVLFFTGG
uniref:Uncharacterized protein n=1 Tax=Elizabethkingia anophelis TaxID=1117645 RepID=A0A455ZI18_9FLAO|nr:TPA_exp: hypothetical protein [Elizabethkingia anophelis]